MRVIVPFLLATVLPTAATADEPATEGVVRTASQLKLATNPDLPACATVAVHRGDPTKGASVIFLKAKTGCVIPWHWHTPMEQVFVISGSAHLEMKHGTASKLGPGSYAMMPSKHAHQFRCLNACSIFVVSDGAFDIHYIDDEGEEISVKEALAAKPKANMKRETKAIVGRP